MLHLFLTLICFLPDALLAFIGTEEKVITAAADAYLPFVDKTDPREGFSLAIIRAAFKIQGYTVKM